jgi:hypothetical protein
VIWIPIGQKGLPRFSAENPGRFGFFDGMDKVVRAGSNPKFSTKGAIRAQAERSGAWRGERCYKSHTVYRNQAFFE